MSAARDRLRLAIVFGGASVEHRVSVRSAMAVLAALDRDRFEALPFGVTQDGTWLRPVESEALLTQIAEGAPECVSGVSGEGLLARPQTLEALATADVVFPLIHGSGGEDGTLQGLLELAGLPYVGAGVAASAIGMDKDLMKTLLARTGIPLVPYRLVTREAWSDDSESVVRTLAELPYPLFVKPANGGSSVGITKVTTREDIDEAIVEALRHDRKVLVEQGVAGREIECAVLGNAAPEASPLGEIRYAREFYDYAAKYEDPGTELIVPADVPASTVERVQAMARAAFLAIDCAGMARVDFFVAEDEEGSEGGAEAAVWLSEINTIPGFTSMSMFPRLWEQAGLAFPALIERLVDLALERHADRQRGGGDNGS